MTVSIRDPNKLDVSGGQGELPEAFAGLITPSKSLLYTPEDVAGNKSGSVNEAARSAKLWRRPGPIAPIGRSGFSSSPVGRRLRRVLLVAGDSRFSFDGSVIGR